MARLTPSQARARNAAEPTRARPDRTTPPRPRTKSLAAQRNNRTPSPRLKSRFRHVHPRVAARTNTQPSAPAPPAGALWVSVEFSSGNDWSGPAHGIPDHLLERWSAIRAGQLPPGDPVPPAPDEEALNAAERDALAELETWGRTAEETTREQAHQQRADTLREADQIDHEADTAQSYERGALRRRANRLRDQAETDYANAQRELDRIADTVRERRTEIRTELERQVRQAQERESERIAELTDGLRDEVNAAIRRHFFSDSPHTLTDWEIN